MSDTSPQNAEADIANDVGPDVPGDGGAADVSATENKTVLASPSEGKEGAEDRDDRKPDGDE